MKKDVDVKETPKFHLNTAENPDAQNLPDTLDDSQTLAASQALAEADPENVATGLDEQAQKDKDYAKRLEGAI